MSGDTVHVVRRTRKFKKCDYSCLYETGMWDRVFKDFYFLLDGDESVTLNQKVESKSGRYFRC